MKIIFISTIFLITSQIAIAAPYVKNLHKKCLSKHQDCALECSVQHINEVTEENISKEAIQCISICVDQHKECEKALAIMRTLNEVAGFTLEDSYLYKPSLPEEDDYE